MAEIFLNTETKTDIQVQETERVPNNMKSKRSSPRHVITKMIKLRISMDLKNSKGKIIRHIQRKSHKALSRFFNRNFLETL